MNKKKSLHFIQNIADKMSVAIYSSVPNKGLSETPE